MRRLLRFRLFSDVRGFTLVELLVCMLILSIMAAIALPAWLDQRAKGEDTEAKLTIRTAALALNAHAVEKGTYDATEAQLISIEPSLAQAIALDVTGDEDSYRIEERSADSTLFWMIRNANGTILRDCSQHGYGLCRADADADGNFW